MDDDTPPDTADTAAGTPAPERDGADAADAAPGALDDAALGRALRQLLTTVDAAAALQPRAERTALLRRIVEAAARMVGAQAASLFLIDPTGTHLTFEVAIGPKADDAAQFTVPMGHGIAGAVAATGQPMAISAPEHDPLFAADIAQGIGHIPQSILCVPMQTGDTIIGVLEALDKIGRPTFTQLDMEVLAQFAEIATLATEQVRRQDDLRSALVEILLGWAQASTAGDGRAQDYEAEMAGNIVLGIDAALASTRTSGDYRESLQIARVVAEIGTAGDAERRLAVDWLTTLHTYLEQRQRERSFRLGSMGGFTSGGGSGSAGASANNGPAFPWPR